MVMPGMGSMVGGGVDLSYGSGAFPRAFEVRQKLYGRASVGVSTRFRLLDRLDAFYHCNEYAHLETAWDGLPADRFETISPDVIVPYGFTQPASTAKDLPIAQRRPSTPFRLCPLVVDRFTGLLFSKERTPKVSVEGDEDAEDFLNAVFKKARFWRTMYQARTHGGSMGSSLVTVQLRKGRFSYTAHSPKTVHDVIWDDPDLKIPAGVLIQYMFLREQEVLDPKTGSPTGKTKAVPHLYRRIIDESMDILFEPAPIEGNRLPVLKIDQNASYEHGLGRFPGTWIQNLPDDELDGVPDCDGAYQMFETVDRQVAQANKGLLYNQDPTLVYGRDKKYDALNIPLRKGSENALNVGLSGSATYLEMSGGGIAASREFIKDVRQAAMDKTQCVLVDPVAISGAAQSAKAIEYVYGPMIEKAGRFREQYGEAIVVLGDVTLELARKWKDPLKYEGRLKEDGVVYDLPLKVVERDADPDNPDPEKGQVIELVRRAPGEGGVVSLEWGAYFAQTPQDVSTEIGNLVTVYSAGGIDQETFVKRVGRLMKVEDVDGLLRRVRDEEEAKQKRLLGEDIYGMAGGDDQLARVAADKVASHEERFADLEAREDEEPEEGDPIAKAAKASDVALNGAQVSAAKEIVLEVAEGKLPRDSGVSMLMNFFNLSNGAAEEIMGTVGAGFSIEPEAPPPGRF